MTSSNPSSGAAEPRHAAQLLQRQAGRELRALRLECNLPGQVRLRSTQRLGRPSGAAPRCGRMPIAAATSPSRSSSPASNDPSARGRVFEAERQTALHLAAADRAGDGIELQRRRLIGGKPQHALAAGVDRAGVEPALEAEIAAGRAVRGELEPRGLAFRRGDAVEADHRKQRRRLVGLDLAVEAGCRFRPAPADWSP